MNRIKSMKIRRMELYFLWDKMINQKKKNKQQDGLNKEMT